MDSDVCLMLLANASHLASRLPKAARTTRQTPFGRCQRPYTLFEYTHTHTHTQKDALTVNIHCQFAGCCWRRHPQREIAGNCFASGRNRLSLSLSLRDRTIDGDREPVGLLHIPAHRQNICRMSEVVSDGTPHTRGRWAGIVFTFSLQAAPRRFGNYS